MRLVSWVITLVIIVFLVFVGGFAGFGCWYAPLRWTYWFAFGLFTGVYCCVLLVLMCCVGSLFSCDVDGVLFVCFCGLPGVVALRLVLQLGVDVTSFVF